MEPSRILVSEGHNDDPCGCAGSNAEVCNFSKF